ncbi:GATOR complex protein depdc5 [Phytophthora boehmeriae]|uniref:GATOR complex protein depdc5 n=1 Tax=Phytophthora boehmeriae TaxID=109152 RepID=A0A8T1WX81_9STRA|nr:GATOR complex protein depdc5 [Phytophthora boehmeriae]
MWRTRRNTSDRDALSLVVHGPEFRNGELLVLNPDLFPEIRLHDLVQVSQPERVHPRLVLSVECLAPVRGKLQVSVAKDIAAQFGLEAFRPVAVRRVDQSDVSVDFVELSFKDQFLSRADIWRFKVTMLGQCVYVGKTVECLGIRSQVDAILANHTHWGCGVIGDATKIVVRSRSSRLFWLVQMSTEMWEFAPDGEIYYEKLLNRLLRVLIAKWSESSKDSIQGKRHFLTPEDKDLDQGVAPQVSTWQMDMALPSTSIPSRDDTMRTFTRWLS